MLRDAEGDFRRELEQQRALWAVGPEPQAR